MTILLGCIADDFTGATDLANNLVRAGMRTVQLIGVPGHGPNVTATPPEPGLEADAVVIALKTRTVPADDAVRQSVAALNWLRRHGAQQIYFKFCSTFDSTPAGNIGPVTDALMDGLGTDFTLATPAFPDNGRAVFKGHLFVGDVLLHESGMRHHPLTPMDDSNLVRVLQAQTTRRVGLIDHAVVSRGVAAVKERIAALRASGVGIAVVDAISNADLLCLGAASSGMALVTAGSGLAIGLPANFGIQAAAQAAALPPAGGRRAIVSGSCSLATQAQVANFIQRGGPAYRVDPLRIAAGEDAVTAALDWAAGHVAAGPVLVHGGSDAARLREVQQQLGVEAAGALVERTLAAIAQGLVHRQGVRQLVVAGGETSGACVQALGITRMRIGPQIDPGGPLVPCNGRRSRWRVAHRAQVRQFRRRRFLHQGLRAAVAMKETQARDEICRVGRSLFDRGLVHASAGNISVRLGEAEGAGYLITPTDACLGFLDPAMLARVDATGRQTSGDRASKTLALHRRIYESATRFDPQTACVIHTHSTHCVALTLHTAGDELLPALTPYFVMKVGHVPVIPYHRPGAPDAAERVAEAIVRYGERGTPIRAVMLSRLGPNVWHDSPAAAMATLEELEETARLWALDQGSAAPLTPAAIDELRATFGARW